MTAPATTAPRAVLYARYSSELQDDRSIADQLAICRAHCERRGYDVVAVFEDRARSSMESTRPGFRDLQRFIRAKEADVVVAEMVERLSRDPGHLIDFWKTTRAGRCLIDTHKDGPCNDVVILVRALTGHMFNSDLSNRVSDRMRERAKGGLVYSKPAYGFRVVPGRPGEKEVDPDKAEVVRRIYRDYINGMSPRVIATALNRERVPAPGRTPWQAQNIHQGGTVAGSKGIIANPVYIGRFRWGIQRCDRDDVTGKRIMTKAEREVVEVDLPHLRIIDDDTWERAQAIREARALGSGARGPRGCGLNPAPNRRQDLLSGLLYCPCGSHMIATGGHPRYGARILCASAHKETGCTIRRTYALWRIEKLVVDGLLRTLSDEDRMKATMERYAASVAQRRRAAVRAEGEIRQRLADIDARIDYLVGLGPLSGIAKEKVAEQLESLSQQEAGLRERLRLATVEVKQATPSQDAIARYCAALATLQADLASGSKRPELREVLRALIERIVVHRVPLYSAPRISMFAEAAPLFGFDPRPQGLSVQAIVSDRAHFGFPKDGESHTPVPLGVYAA